MQAQQQPALQDWVRHHMEAFQLQLGDLQAEVKQLKASHAAKEDRNIQQVHESYFAFYVSGVVYFLGLLLLVTRTFTLHVLLNALLLVDYANCAEQC